MGLRLRLVDTSNRIDAIDNSDDLEEKNHSAIVLVRDEVLTEFVYDESFSNTI